MLSTIFVNTFLPFKEFLTKLHLFSCKNLSYSKYIPEHDDVPAVVVQCVLSVSFPELTYNLYLVLSNVIPL